MNKIKKAVEVMLRTDVYKVAHKTLYPKGTELVFSNFTPRSGNWAPKGSEGVVAIGMKYVINYIRQEFKEKFFSLNIEEMLKATKLYQESIKRITNAEIDTHDWEKLWELGKLPLEFRAMPEGSFVPFKSPVLTIHNTNKEFAWLVNYLETWLSSELWPIITAATKAKMVKEKLLHYAEITGTNKAFVNFQAHDFSFRGMEGSHGAKLVGMGHLHFFDGSDNLPAILETGKGQSVLATEHSIMSAGTKEKEFETYKRLIQDNPDGILSIVSDTWNIYNVVDKILPQLKKEIESRNGSLVIRPDSGDPITQLLGEPSNGKSGILASQKELGLFRLIEKHFGATTNEKGYKVLPITFLWGDGMTLERIDEVYTAMEKAGWASENLIIGVGSYMYQLNTRDTYGFAMKATYVEVNGEGRNITKDPITDSGVKKSATGLLVVIDGKLIEKATYEQVISEQNELKIVVE